MGTGGLPARGGRCGRLLEAYWPASSAKTSFSETELMQNAGRSGFRSLRRRTPWPGRIATLAQRNSTRSMPRVRLMDVSDGTLGEQYPARASRMRGRSSPLLVDGSVPQAQALVDAGGLGLQLLAGVRPLRYRLAHGRKDPCPSASGFSLAHCASTSRSRRDLTLRGEWHHARTRGSAFVPAGAVSGRRALGLLTKDAHRPR